jgi:hypothetical protein
MRMMLMVVPSTNLVIVLGMMQLSKKIPFDDPQVLLGVRILYAVSNLLILGIYFYVQTQINKKKGAYDVPPGGPPGNRKKASDPVVLD